jgi:TolB-like protein
MGGFFAELKRRHMFRVAAAYAVVAWLILQVVNNVAPVLDLPVWVARAFLLALVVGFPIALLFVWMRDLAPADASAPKAAVSKLDYVLAGGLILVIGLVSYQQLAPSGTTTVEGKADAGAAAQTNAGTGTSISIAVLPFANLSGDSAQDFFSDGMTEEISAVLAQVQGLTVLGRSSAFQFKGQNSDPRDVGRALNATHLIEGSVRKSGERVRITAQLVRSENGAQLWSETYDRQLNDIFAVQEEIAEAITASLSVPLGLAQGDSLVRDRTRDVASYDQYLRAKVLVRARGPIEPGGPLIEAATLLEQVVARDPAFAPAWAMLAQTHALIPNFVPAASRSVDDQLRFFQASNAKAEMVAREAMRLDPRSAVAYATLARVQARAGEFAAADDLYRQALALDPAEPEVLTSFSVTLAVMGRLREGLSVREKLRTLEPFVPNYNALTGYYMLMNGQTQPAIALMESLPADAAISLKSALAQAYAAEGRYAEAANAILSLPKPTPESGQIVQDAARLLRTAPAKVTAPRELPDLDWLGFVYAYVGAEDRLMDYFEHAQAAGAGPTNEMWQPAYAPARKTERFKAWARRAGLVDYWRARGWPDLCRSVGADDFVCD